MGISTYIARGGRATVTIPAGAALAVMSAGVATVSAYTTYAQEPPQVSLVGYSVPGVQYTTSTYSSGATLQIDAPFNHDVYYEIGTAPLVKYTSSISGSLAGGTGAAQAFNATATLTIANLLGQLITSTTAAAVTATLPTATIFDAGTSFGIGDFYEFSVINTGATNAFTIATAAGWTLVGNMVVALSSSGKFIAVKTAANTFSLYRAS